MLFENVVVPNRAYQKAFNSTANVYRGVGEFYRNRNPKKGPQPFCIRCGEEIRKKT